jgi:MFS family permease
MNLALLHNRNFALLWLAQIISKFGDVFYNVAIMVTVFEQTGSALQTAGVMVATALPSFLLGPAAGVLVDRFSRRHVMLATDLMRASLLAVLLVLVVNNQLSVWGIYLIVAGLSAASTFFEPARLAIVPSVVPQEELVQANSLVMTTNQAVLALGYALGGTLILLIGFEAMIVLDLASFLVAVLAVALIQIPGWATSQGPLAQRMALHQAVADGLRYLRSHTLARPLIIMEIMEHFPHAIWTSALMLVFTREALGAGSAVWGWQNAIFYGGQMAGATLAAVMAMRLARRPGWAIVGNAFLFSLLTIAYALSPSVAFTLVLCFCFGPTSAMRDVAQDSLLQASVDSHVMGRLYATRNMFANLAFMLAGIGFAWLADQVDVRWVYGIGGLLYLATAIFAFSSTAIRSSRIGEVPSSA